MNHILKCPSCKSYGLSEKCSCGGTRVKPRPPKYSPEDRYGNYRRQFNKEKAEESQAGESE